MSSPLQISKTDMLKPGLMATAKAISLSAGLFSILAGGLVLYGWKFDLMVLKSISPHFVSMKPNTALGLILMGLALCMAQERWTRSWARYLSGASAAAIVVLGASTLLEYLFKTDLGIDQLLFTEAPGAIYTIFPARMAFITAITFILAGAAILFLNTNVRRRVSLAHALAMGIFAATYFILITYFHGITVFNFGIGVYNAMALHTAAAFFLISIGILCARPEFGLSQVFVTGSHSGTTSRRLLFAVVILPVVLSMIQDWGENAKLYDMDFGMHIFYAVVAVCLGAFVWINANLMERREVEHQRAETMIKTSESRYRRLFEAASDGIMILNAVTGEIEKVNPAMLRMLRYPLKYFLHKKLWELSVFKGETDFKKDFISRVKESGVFSHPVELKLQTKDGAPIDVEFACIHYNEGHHSLIQWSMRDVSRAKEIERMKSEFVSIASHQLHAPLTAIKWHVEILLDEILSEKAKKYLQQIHLSNEHMIQLVSDLLDVSRIEKGVKFTVAPKPLDIIPLIKEMIANQEMLAAQSGVKLKLADNFPASFTLNIDEEKMRHVWQNLIDNAVKYSFPQSDVVVGFKTENSAAIFSVRNRGIGIPTQQQDRVFQKFFRADNAAKLNTHGTGLGLYIVKAIVDGHGGKIWFESEENKDTTFYFSLPLNK